MLQYRKFFPILAFLFLFQTARGMTLPLFPQYYQSINLSAFGIGLAFAAYGGSFLVFEALWGFVFERHGIKGIMPPLAIAFTTVAVLLFARPANLLQLLGIETLLGLGLGGAGVFPRLAIAHQAEIADRGRAFGMLGFIYSIGATLGSLLGGASGSLIGVSRSFVIAAAITIASVIPVWLSNRSQKKIREVEVIQNSPHENGAAGGVRFNKAGIVVLCFVGLIAAGGNAFFSLLFPNILLKETQLSTSVVGISIIIALYNLSTGLVQPLTASRGSKNSAKWITGCLIATGLCYFALIFAQNITQVEIITIALGAAYSAITPLALSLLTTFISRGYWGRIIGIYGAAEDVGLVVGSSLSSFVWGLWGPESPLAMMGSIYGAVGLTCLFALRAQKLGQSPKSMNSIRD